MPDYEKKRALIEKFELDPEANHRLYRIDIDAEGHIVRRGSKMKGYNIPEQAMDPDLMTTLRIQCLAPDDPEVEEYSGPVCPRNEAEVCHLLMSLIQAMLARCDTTVEEDRELWREGYKGDGTP